MDKQVIQTLKQRLNIVDVVRRYVSLRPGGGRQMGLCPFHQEKTPSFSVNEAEGFFYCFGCQAGGDVLDFYQRVNKDMVSLEPVEHKYDVSLLKDLIREHVELTGSPRGKEILDNFGEYLPKFKKVLPHDYDKMLRLIAQMEEKGEDSEQAQIEAFYAMKSAK